jgi:lysylphosphatidylglycerol synthetase-like protein (DUF2156 family)
VRRPPLTVLAFAVVVAAALLWLVVVGGIYVSLLAGAAVLVLATFGFASGVRVAWIFLTIVAVADLVYAVATWPAWGALLVNGTLLVLLLAAATRRHVRAGGWP